MDLFQEKEKDRGGRRKEEGRESGRKRNSHCSLKWRDELGKSECISVVWRWVAHSVPKKKWYLFQFTPNLVSKGMAPQRICKLFFFSEIANSKWRITNVFYYSSEFSRMCLAYVAINKICVYEHVSMYHIICYVYKKFISYN